MLQNNTANNVEGSTMMVMLPESEWLGLRKSLENIKELVLQRNADELNSEWIESGVARKMLGVSQKTWQNYRDERKIPFSQFGRKIYVKRCDLEAFMQSHYISAR